MNHLRKNADAITMPKPLLALLLIFSVLTQLLTLLTPSLLWQTVGALLFLGFAPGLLLVEALVGRTAAPPAVGERLIYSVAAGYMVMVVTGLLLSYLPGGLQAWQIYGAFNVILLALTAFLWRWEPVDPPTAVASLVDFSPARRWLITGVLVVGILGGFLRFTNLGYAEYHGDEARAVLRAAAVIQGDEEALVIHRKGPTEILLPTLLYTLGGHLSETTSRLPFACAGVAALFAIWLLGARLFGPLAGFATAFLLLFDGYYIGFAHIVQYQSVVILTSATAVLILHRLVRRPLALTNYLVLAALMLATGLLSHYEGALAALPAVYLLGLLWRQQPAVRGDLLRAAVWAGLIGAVVLAIFFVPFLLHPQFTATYRYLTERRIGIGGPFPYNNLEDVFLRSTVYNSTYFELLRLVGWVGALALVYAQLWGKRVGLGVAGLFALCLLVTAWRTDWLVIGETDYTFALFALVLLPILISKRTPAEERAIWLWFGAGFLVAMFFTLKVRTHIYIFLTPWMLLVGLVIDRVAAWLGRYLRPPTLKAVGMGAALVSALVFGSYAYWYFVYNQVEILRTWETNRPAGYWAAYDRPDHLAMFGFPLTTGWKVVGALFADGTISGRYETNEEKDWGPIWYTRGRDRCERGAQWYFEIDSFEPISATRRQSLQDFLKNNDFHRWGVVTVRGAQRMVIYKRGAVTGPVQTLPWEEYIARFDAITSPDLPLSYPVLNPKIAQPLHVNLGNLVWLEGYEIHYPQPLKPGDVIQLTLYWRAQQPISDTYKVFNQSFYGNGTMVAQLDGYPLCGRRNTWLWDPGELITDFYEIPVKTDAPDGLYPLITGMYHEQTGDRLNVLDAAGNSVGGEVHLTDIRIGEE